MTAEDCMRQAWQALLRGDVKARDEWMERAKHAIRAPSDGIASRITPGARGSRENPIKLVEQPDGSYAPERAS